MHIMSKHYFMVHGENHVSSHQQNNNERVNLMSGRSLHSPVWVYFKSYSIVFFCFIFCFFLWFIELHAMVPLVWSRLNHSLVDHNWKHVMRYTHFCSWFMLNSVVYVLFEMKWVKRKWHCAKCLCYFKCSD